jgi:endonuclease YncB( thermonuclease family)
MVTLSSTCISCAADQTCPPAARSSGLVVAIDDHLDLTLDEGTRLKLAGIDPPQPTPDDPDLDTRVRGELAGWLLGQEVAYMAAEPGRDRWGRLVAFAWAPAPQPADGQSRPPLSVGEALIDAGLARYEPSPAAHPCRSALLAAEASARAARLGLWADPYYAVIEAGARERFSDKAGSSIIVEGRVAGISARGGRLTFYLGPRKGLEISVTLLPSSSKAFEAAYASLAGLSGERVRVRGLLNTRFGPQIEISSPDAVEVTGQSEGAAVLAPPGQ